MIMIITVKLINIKSCKFYTDKFGDNFIFLMDYTLYSGKKLENLRDDNQYFRGLI